MLEAVILLENEVETTRVVMINFCETNNFEVLNGKFISYTSEEFAFVNKWDSGVIDYALASEGIIKNILNSKTGMEVMVLICQCY